ncbi:Disease resistance protein RPP13 [Hordeum vulgare]|nr:Disease resistance protein RPP13 [Hordeum vulgare]
MAIEVGSAVACVAGRMLPKALDYLQNNHRLRERLMHDIKHIQSEFSFISGVIAGDGDYPRWSGNNLKVHEQWIMKVRELTHEIEDCIDRYIHRVTLEKKASWIHRKVHRVKTRSIRNKFVAEILRLKMKSMEIRYLRETYANNENTGGGSIGASNGGGDDSKSDSGSDGDGFSSTNLYSGVGGDGSSTNHNGCWAPKPHDELMELIRETSTQGQPNAFKVISIVGFDGIGKTQLARNVYNTIGSQYDARAWVLAGEKGAKVVLKDILEQLGKNGSTRKELKECLGNKRFLIVIDDMREEFWEAIQGAFPVVSGVSSRVIITTVRQSIATVCSARDGHVYVVRTLDDIHSRKLFVEKAKLECPPPSGLQVIKKCDGLPLALVTTARVLHGDPTEEEWTDLGENLGEELERKKELVPMQSVLVRSYTSLGNQDIRTFLLYMGIYPSDRPMGKGSLIRKWLAEGLISSDRATKRSALEVSVANFKELIDRSIIQPIDASNSNGAGVKTCQTHGIMLEFIVRKSMCQNFVAFLYDNCTPPRNDVRWLSLHNRTAANDPMDLHLVRSLTIFGKAHKSLLDFSKYKMMRVLDLEQCDEHLGDKHLKKICNNLSLLRYLSLRGASRVTVLPKKIKKLQLLETLDLRGTSIEILPEQVLKLPYLIHLFGKFKFQQGVGGWRMGKLQTWLKENSKLATLDGFVMDNKSHQFAQLMKYMDQLTKVKIWCESAADANSRLSNVSKAIKGLIKRGADSDGNSSQLSEAIQEFIERGTQLHSLSLSLNFNDKESQDDLLMHLSIKERPDSSLYPYLKSFKLQGNSMCSQLPPFVTMLRGLTKLCLSFPGHNLSGDILAALRSAHNLWYLKLVATQLDNLAIGQDALRNLRRLCIVVEVVTGLVIGEEHLLFLESLQLLCKDLNGFRGTTIYSLSRLKEVALHAGMSEQTKPEWVEATKNHPRRPKLLFKPMGSQSAAQTSTTATETVGNSGNPAAPPTDMTVRTTSGAIYNAESAQFVTTEMGSESERPAETTMDMPLSFTMLHNAISKGESVPVATSETVSEPAEKTHEGPAPTTDNTTSSMNHDAITSARQHHAAPTVTSVTGSETATQNTEAPATTVRAALLMNRDAIIDAHAQQEHFGQVNGESQHDDHVPNNFSTENGPSTIMASVKKDMEGMAV